MCLNKREILLCNALTQFIKEELFEVAVKIYLKKHTLVFNNNLEYL